MGFTSSSSLYVVGDPLVTSNRNRIAIMAAAARLATMLGNRENVDAGGLMSYGQRPQIRTDRRRPPGLRDFHRQ